MGIVKQSLFQYVVLLHPTEKESKEEDKSTEIIISPKEILAVDKDTAAMSASMDIPIAYKAKLNQIEIIVRPF